MNIHVPAPELQSDIIAITGLAANLDRAKTGLLDRVKELQAEQEDRVSKNKAVCLGWGRKQSGSEHISDVRAGGEARCHCCVGRIWSSCYGKAKGPALSFSYSPNQEKYFDLSAPTKGVEDSTLSQGQVAYSCTSGRVL